MGACRRQELYEMKFEHVTDAGSHLLVHVPHTKNKKSRSFTVTGKYYEICKKYMNKRPCTGNKCFFLNYRNQKCTVQNVGINKIGEVGKVIATFLNIEHPELYTGHCFRRSSATLLVDNRADILTLKRHGGWKSTTVAESYVEESVQNKLNISNNLIS